MTDMKAKQEAHDAQVLKDKASTPLQPSGNVLSTPAPIPGAATPTGVSVNATTPTKAEADKIVDQRTKEALAAQEKKNKEAQVEKEKQQKLDQEENERRSLIQRAADGEAVSVPASKVVQRYNTEDGLPPRYEAGNLEPINAKKPTPTPTVVNPR